ncbi:response regulator [Cytophagales bacterium LB-30]|uniref:Response regulator n=1 Tax=Shiella aurantiaca TaxID=3058365 RepID=A0ABT8F5B3_9BACT|nr:response regulator [Shiella aurantiaca]MDN4165646.1 response regulator [Shiella aurantiaca]
MKYKAIVIDDEQAARTLLKGMLEEFCSDIEVVSTCEDLPNGVKAIRKYKPDLVFLDIEMPGHSGLELLDFFDTNEINFSIIFTTAYNNYAIQAFKLSAIDYLLKPIEPEELEKTIDRFKKLTEKTDYSILKSNLSAGSPKKLAIPTVSSIKFIETNNILFLKADGAYTHIYLDNANTIVSSKSLKTFEENLSENRNFFRCHKSYIVNLHYVTDFIKSDGGYIKIAQKFDVTISSEKTSEMLKLMNSLS